MLVESIHKSASNAYYWVYCTICFSNVLFYVIGGGRVVVLFFPPPIEDERHLLNSVRFRLE